jgi:VWFA-related protein
MLDRRPVYAAVLSVLLFLHPLVLSAQQAGQFVEVLEVRVTNVDVVATDKDGNPVAGLKPSDFEVYEEGKKQEITHFAEFGSKGASAVLLAEGGAPTEVAAQQTPRKFIFYFDDSSLSLKNRHDVFAAIKKFLASNLRPEDRVMLVSWNRDLKVRVPWTGDLNALNTSLDALLGENAAASFLQAEKQRVERLLQKMLEEAQASEPSPLKPTWTEIENAARGYADAYKFDVTQSTNAMARLLASLSGVDGRKVLVIATEMLPTFAGAEMFEHMENLRNAALTSGNPLLAAVARQGSRVTDISRYNVQPALEVLARAANATGVTVYGINPKGLSGPASGKTEQQNARDVSIEFAESNQVLSGINLLANRTGGVAMIGAPGDMALARVGRDLGAYYSLGYRSRPGAAPERKIEVRATRPGVQVRTRTNIYYRSLEREMADRVIANHLQSELPNELGVALQSDPVTTDGSRKLLPVRVVIPVDRLTLLPDGNGNMTGGFSVFTCSGDGQGGTSGVNVQSQAINFTAEQAAQMKGRRIGFAIQVPLENGRHQVSIGVVDHVSQEQGFATMKATL